MVSSGLRLCREIKQRLLALKRSSGSGEACEGAQSVCAGQLHQPELASRRDTSTAQAPQPPSPQATLVPCAAGRGVCGRICPWVLTCRHAYSLPVGGAQ